MPRTLFGMSKWCLFGKFVPRAEIVFYLSGNCNLCHHYCEHYNFRADLDQTSLWVSLLLSCLEYLLPSPTINKKKKNSWLVVQNLKIARSRGFIFPEAFRLTLVKGIVRIKNVEL